MFSSNFQLNFYYKTVKNSRMSRGKNIEALNAKNYIFLVSNGKKRTHGQIEDQGSYQYIFLLPVLFLFVDGRACMERPYVLLIIFHINNQYLQTIPCKEK